MTLITSTGRPPATAASAASVLLGIAVALSLFPSAIPYLLAGAVATMVAPTRHQKVLSAALVATVGWTPWPLPAAFGAVAWWISGGRPPTIGPSTQAVHARSLAWQLPSAAVLGLIGVAISWDRIGGDASPLMPLERPPVLVTIVVVAALAAANAGAEEALWRVALLSEQSADPAPNMWLAQAMSFGIAHWAGLPYGPAGVLASGTLSLVLMLARARYGFLRVLIIHGVVDVVIFAAVFMFAIYPPS